MNAEEQSPYYSPPLCVHLFSSISLRFSSETASSKSTYLTREKLHQTIQALIADGNTKEVFSFLRKQDLPAQQSATIALIEAEFNELQKSSLKGVISFQEERLAKNKINDKLLSLYQAEGSTIHPPNKTSNLSRLLVGVLLLAFAGGLIWWFGSVQHTCPSFPKEVRNKIIIMPFENVAGGVAKPQTVLIDRINQLAHKNNLSTVAGLGASKDVNRRNASLIAQNCKANVIIWGTYSSSDSLRINLNYHFSNDPQKNKIGNLIEVKDVMDLLRQGKILKTQDDAILALCGVIAMREGNQSIAKKWFEKLKEKEEMDRQLLDALQ